MTFRSIFHQSVLERLAFLCLSGMAGAAEFQSLTVPDRLTVPPAANRAYRLLVPETSGPPARKFPLVVYLHGAGAKGNDNAKPLTEPLPRMLATAEWQTRFPCLVLVPQCRAGNEVGGGPNNWVKWENQTGTPPAQWVRTEPEPTDQMRAAIAALAHVVATQPVDPQRIYLTGVSMGGSAAWHWAAREPDRFAAAIIVCGLSEAGKAPLLAKLPLWTFHGSEDSTVPIFRTRAMVEQLKALGSPVKFTEYQGAGHNIADRVFTENDQAVLRWLMEHRRVPP